MFYVRLLVLNWGQFCSPEDVWQNPEIFVAATGVCVCVCVGGVCVCVCGVCVCARTCTHARTNGISRVEARDAARRLNSSQGSRRELSDPNVSDTKVETPLT